MRPAIAATSAAVLVVASLLRLSSAQACGGRIVSSPATISSPNFPRYYPPNAQCKWTVLAPAGRSVQIKVVKFAIGEGIDVLRIFDGLDITCDTPLTAYTQGDAAAGSNLLLGRNVTVAFWSDDKYSATGFQLSVTFVNATGPDRGTSSATPTTTPPSTSSCGGSMTGSGRLTSPNYPAPYAPNGRCVWKLNPAAGQQVTIRIVSLRLESPWDTLRVYLTSSPGVNELPAAEYTGTVAGVTTSFRAGLAVTVVFTSDESNQYTGFEAVFYSNVSSVIPTTPPSILPSPGTCGVPAVSVNTKAVEESNRIVGGVPAVPQEWPWQAQLTYSGSFICGGSLISSQWVVTAAHCIVQPFPSLFVVLLGKYNQRTTDSTLQRFSVARIIVHPEYDKYPDDSDIALIKLARPVTFNDAIRPVCLPMTDIAPGANCSVTGWGDTQRTGSAAVLREAWVPILSRSCCKNFLQDSFTKNMTCAGYIAGGKDTCQGDSGGPLVCKINGTFWLYGITSFGFGCAVPTWPGVYTRVPGFINWIRQVVANN